MPVVSSRTLRESGLSGRAIATAVADARLIRLRTGWYATPGTSVEVITAVRCGGSLSCGAALRSHGVWVVRRDVHVRVSPSARVHGRTTRLHRMHGDSHDGIDDVMTALVVAIRCMPFEEAVCALDSALQLGMISRSAARSRFTSPGESRVLAAADRRSESGIETLARLRLRSRGIRVRVQVAIAGIGRVDLLVGDRLVIETDGDTWHSTAEQREHDRRRDSALISRGFLVMRVGYARVMNEWDGFLKEVLAVVRRDEHLWRRIHAAGVSGVR
ncbi:MAG: DUF559 domain-containing protein [Acidobacteria bacterium]|nr:DUF559 domain-containing protein [Acidobacteriota bacterium]